MRVRVLDRLGNWVNVLFGFLGDEAFLLIMVTPSEDALTMIMPTWNRMLESIKPVEDS